MTYATALAQDYGARLDLLHVLPPTAPSIDARGARDVPFQQLQALAATAADSHVEVRTEMRTGNIEEEIARAIEANRAELLVMGTHGRHGFKRWLRGSVTEHMLRRIFVPVLTVGEDQKRADFAPPSIRRVLVAIDFSEGTSEALAYAFSIAQECQAEVTLLHIVDDLFGVDAGGNHFEELIARRILDRLQALVPSEAKDWCQIKTHVGVGIPADVILSNLQTKDIDLLVMNIHDKGHLARALLGRTAEKVVRSATCPVLLVPAGAKP